MAFLYFILVVLRLGQGPLAPSRPGLARDEQARRERDRD
jgi:hypothetical protein